MDHTYVAAATLYRYRIPFNQPFVTAGRSFREREGLIFELRSDDGNKGIGEAAPLPGFSRENIEEALIAAIQAHRYLNGIELPNDCSELSAVLAQLQSRVDLPSSVCFGIESALIELAAKAAGLPAAKWLNPTAERHVAVNAVISGSDTDVAEIAASKFSAGYRTFKLKVGGRTMADDLARVETIRRAVGDKAKIRLDANRGWSYAEAESFLRSAAVLDIEYIEEPLTDPRWDELHALRDRTAVPIALDESLSAWLAETASRDMHPCFAVAILKPPVYGGICTGLKLIRKLRALDVKCVVTSSLDTANGISVTLHLALAAGMLGVACGFDTLALLESPLALHALKIEEGLMHLPDATGFGIALRESDWNYLTRVLYAG